MNLNINKLIRISGYSGLIFCILFLAVSCKSKENIFNHKQKTKAIDPREIVLEPEKTIILQGVKGRIDHMGIDVANRLLFIAALGNNSIEEIDLKKGERVNSIKGIDEPQGIVFIPGSNLLCASSGKNGTINFYDEKTLKLKSSIKIGTDADNLRYDSTAKNVYAGYGDGGIAVINVENQTLTSTITLAAHPEAFSIDDSTGRIYVNVPSEKIIAVINSKNNTVADIWHISNASSNFPIALDEEDHYLFSGFRNPPVIAVYDIKLSKEISRFETKEDVDDIFYDTSDKLVFISSGEGFLQVFKHEYNNEYKLLQEIKTSRRARTSLFVPELKEVFVAAPGNGNKEAGILVFRITT